MDFDSLKTIILDPAQSPESRKEALEEILKTGSPQLKSLLEQLLESDSSILRFKARKELRGLDTTVGQAPAAQTPAAQTPAAPSAEAPAASAPEQPQPAPPVPEITVADKPAPPREEEPKPQPSGQRKARPSRNDRPERTGSNGGKAGNGGNGNGFPSGSQPQQDDPGAAEKVITALKENGQGIVTLASYGCVAAVLLIFGWFLFTHGQALKKKMASSHHQVETPSDSAPRVSAPNLTPDQKLKEGLRLSDQKQYDKALVLLREALQAFEKAGAKPDQDTMDQVYWGIAAISLERQNPSEADDMLKRMWRKVPDRYISVARAYEQTGKPAAALALVRRAIGEIGEDRDLLITGIDMAVLSDDTTAVTEWTARLRELYPDTPELLMSDFMTLTAQGATQEALDAVSRLPEKMRSRPEILMTRARLHRSLRDFRKAALCMEQAMAAKRELTTDPAILFEAAMLHNHLGNIGKAFQHYRRSVELNREFLMKSDGGILDKARSRFETVHSLAPDDPVTASELAWVEYLAGNLEYSKKLFQETASRSQGHLAQEANEMLQRLANISITPVAVASSGQDTPSQGDGDGQDGADPDSREQGTKPSGQGKKPSSSSGSGAASVPRVEKRARVDVSQENMAQADEHFNRGNIFFENEEWDRAVPEFQAAYDLNPNDTEALTLLAGIHQNKLKDYDQALRCYRELLTLDPDNQNTYVNIGEILVRQENPSEAIAWFTRANEMNPESDLGNYSRKVVNLLKKKVAAE